MKVGICAFLPVTLNGCCSRGVGGSRTDFLHSAGSWIVLDLGPSVRVVNPTAYALRYGGGHVECGGYPRNWVLEGSIDGRTWLVLKGHTNDETLLKSQLKAPGLAHFEFASAVFGIRSVEAGTYGGFRGFRLRMTGENSHGGNALCVSGWELYGTLRIDSGACSRPFTPFHD